MPVDEERLAEAEKFLGELLTDWPGFKASYVPPTYDEHGYCDMCGVVVQHTEEGRTVHTRWHWWLTVMMNLNGAVGAVAAARTSDASGVSIRLRCDHDGCPNEGTVWDVELPKVDEGLIGHYAADLRCDGCLTEPTRA
jgi:hypothetical protein